MLIRKLSSLLVLGAVTAALMGGPNSAIAAGGAKGVAKDAAGDWALEGNAAVSPLGDALGQDLLKGSIGMKNKKTLNFIIKVGNLPPTGGWPEVTRYIWSLSVDKKYVELDGKFTNYSRGACDPTSGQCPPPRDPGQAPFLVRGDCEQIENTTVCKEKGIVHATFKPASGTITIPVPMKMIRAKRGSVISAGMSTFTTELGGSIVAIPSAFLSSAAFPADAMQMTGKFKIPL
jgi:hypothetical protein